MKIIKIIFFVCLVGFLFQIYAKINLDTSLKHEVDLLRTHVKVSNLDEGEKEKEYERINLVEKDILKQKRVVEILYWILLSGLVITLLIWVLNKIRSKSNLKV